ncbi:Mitochondrial GTPase 1 [Didymella pomorum]|uniref:Mitochondrial GTPase 1 n=1 Tax=Didymella pomorum TaxID=749634 RepID=A0A9W9DBC2_9PLEO|nr:Mitochondrial GTPase 1 [Didymella pomorum]
MRPSITTAAVALFSMVTGTLVHVPYRWNVTRHAAIHLFAFATTGCQGNPHTSPFELRNGHCVKFRDPLPLSAKPALWKGRRSDYIEEINHLHNECKIELFSDNGCQADSRVPDWHGEVIEQTPSNFNKCLSPISPMFIRSARFSCGKVENPVHLFTKALDFTSWSIEPFYGNPVPFVQEVTLTGTLKIPDGPTPEPSSNVLPRKQSLQILVKQANQTATLSGTLQGPVHTLSSDVLPRSQSVHPLVERENQPGKGVWMLHPWSMSWICYSCYLKQVNPRGKMECRSGLDFLIDCPGPVPAPYSTAITYSTTTTFTSTTTVFSAYPASTKTPHAEDFSSNDSLDKPDNLQDDMRDFHPLMKRKSWHTPVKFDHPFQKGKNACADAEWEKRGWKKSYIKIQHVHICDHKDRKDSRWIGLPPTDVRTSIVPIVTTAMTRIACGSQGSDYYTCL